MPALVVPTSVLVGGLTAVAAAGSRLAVAEAALPLLLDLPGVRAGAVVARSGSEVVVQGSAGYDCGAMAPGQRLPLDAGLPVTEAVRTSRTVVRGSGPSWVAAPFRRRSTGALLLSLDGAPPEDCGPVEVLARAVGDALERVQEAERALVDLAAAAPDGPALAEPAVAEPALDSAARSVPADGAASGDVVLCLADRRGGHWLVVADVCGSGPSAAVVAHSVAAAVQALAPYSTGPADLLSELERSLGGVVGPESFVTAAVVHLGAQGTAAASAGHPPPLLLQPSGPTALPVPAGPPLALDTGRGQPYEQVPVTLPPGALLLLHTDGLVDRSGARGTDPLSLMHEITAAEPAQVLEQVLAAAEAAGRAVDDAAVLVVRVPRG